MMSGSTRTGKRLLSSRLTALVVLALLGPSCSGAADLEAQDTSSSEWCSSAANHSQIHNAAVALGLPISPYIAAQVSDEGLVEYVAPEDAIELRLGEQLRPFLAAEDFEAACSEAWLERDSGIHQGELALAPPPERPEVEAPEITDPLSAAYIEFAAEKLAGTSFEDVPSWGLINLARQTCEQLDEGVSVDEAAQSLMNMAMLDAPSTEEGSVLVFVVLVAGVDSTCPWHTDSVTTWLSSRE